MDFFVGAQVAALGEGLAAARNGTDVGSFAGVSAHVNFQGGRAVELRLAYRTRVGSRGLTKGRNLPFVAMGFDVVLEMPLGDEAASAVRIAADERSFARVNAHVRLQIPLLREPLAAALDLAHKRPLSRLC
jgi:hypothetical protein